MTCGKPGASRILAAMTASRFAFLLFIGLAGSPIARATDWNVVQQQGRDYVSFANVAQFYQFPEFTRASRTVSLRGEHRAIRAQAGTSEMSINGVRFFTDFPLLTNAGEELVSAMDVSKIIEPVLRPSRIQNSQKVETVVLDPGHGGTDSGASNRWGSEKAFTLDVALSAREQLVRAGFKVEMTRSGDAGLALQERVDFANRFQNALFVSIHFNSASGGAGLESYSLAPAGVPSNASTESHLSAVDLQTYPGNSQDGQNIALTAAIHASTLSRLGVYDRGVRHGRFHVLRDIKVPATLLECGFLSDPAEGQRIATAQYRQRLGAAIAQGIQNYNAAVNYRSGGSTTFAAAKMILPAHERSITEPLRMERPPESREESKPSVSISAGD